MFQLYRVALAITSVFFVACTHTPKVRQRAYIDAALISDQVAPGNDVDRSSLARRVEILDTTISAEPVQAHPTKQAIEDLAFKKNLKGNEKKKFIENSVNRFLSKTCFTIDTRGPSGDGADLKYYDVYVDIGERPELLTNQMDSGSGPKKDTREASYNTGGYGSTIGTTTYYSPSRTHVYSYDVFSDEGVFCSKNKLDLSQGVSLFIRSRQKRGIPVADLYWFVDQKEIQELYSDYPSYEWLEKRHAHIESRMASVLAE